jgi:hypothetical protein
MHCISAGTVTARNLWLDVARLHRVPPRPSGDQPPLLACVFMAVASARALAARPGAVACSRARARALRQAFCAGSNQCEACAAGEPFSAARVAEGRPRRTARSSQRGLSRKESWGHQSARRGLEVRHGWYVADHPLKVIRYGRVQSAQCAPRARAIVARPRGKGSFL